MTQLLATGVIRAGILTIRYMADGRVIVETLPVRRIEPAPLPERMETACPPPC